MAAPIVAPPAETRATFGGGLWIPLPLDALDCPDPTCWYGEGTGADARREPRKRATGTRSSGLTWGSASSPLLACAFSRLIRSAWRWIREWEDTVTIVRYNVQKEEYENEHIYYTKIISWNRKEASVHPHGYHLSSNGWYISNIWACLDAGV